jgi:flagellar biosynthetic protein FlhB
MADSAQRTEKPTPRRLERARKEGNFPASREFVTAVHFLGVVILSAAFGGTVFTSLMRAVRRLLAAAFAQRFTVDTFLTLARDLIAPVFVPLALGGVGLMFLVAMAQLATTRLGLAGKKLLPDGKRLNPFPRLKNLPGQNLPVLLQALILLPLVGAVVYFELAENIGALLELSWMGPQPALVRIAATVETLLWRAAGLFLLVGLADLAWQRRRYFKQLRMTRHEVREEHKESEGNPQIKQRVRRIQRDLARRQMMKEIPKATAVIVNPTHYAVAIRYAVPAPGQVTGAPKVIAKGKNYLAARIRKKAQDNQVPIVENPPLARALYSSVEVGQEIPAHLYRAVAEVLAYIYRLMGGRLPG